MKQKGGKKCSQMQRSDGWSMEESLFHLRLGGVGSHPPVLRACFLGSSGVRGPWVAGLQLMWGQVGSWAPALSHGLVFPPPRTISFIVLFSQYLKDVSVPLPSYQRGKKCHLSPVYLFQIFPVRWGFWRPGDRGRGIVCPPPPQAVPGTRPYPKGTPLLRVMGRCCWGSP